VSTRSLAHTRGLVIAVVVVLGMATVGAASRRPRTDTHQAAASTCKDEQGDSYSNGSLRKVESQIQKCEVGKWVLDPMSMPKGAVLEKGKACRSDMPSDRHQEYASGLLHVVGKKLERCDDGKWLAAPSRGGLYGLHH
jgi:hypothetical protein